MSLAGPIVNTGQYMSQINLSFPHCSLQPREYILFCVTISFFASVLVLLMILFKV